MIGMKTARYWHTRDDGKIQCELCPHGCVLGEGQTGICRVRSVEGKELKALGYGALSSANLDPVEKKPLYHFHPGAAIFSIGGWGCNFGCVFCQNWTISQRVETAGRRYAPEAIVKLAGAGGSIGVAYTYNEPLVGIEFVRDCAERVRAAGLANVLVTNGYIEEKPLRELLPLIDAANVDLKFIDPDLYKRYSSGKLAVIQNSIKIMHEIDVHVELTHLLVSGLADNPDHTARLADWIASLDPNIPLHLSRYFPRNRWSEPPTSSIKIEKCYYEAKKRLRYVYIGNFLTSEGSDTFCPGCSNLIVRRNGYQVEKVGLTAEGKCDRCGYRLNFLLKK